jgi:hypothetical protein
MSRFLVLGGSSSNWLQFHHIIFGAEGDVSGAERKILETQNEI